MTAIADLTPHRVLVADDAPIMRDTLGVILQQCGVKSVTSAKSGKEAFHALRADPKPVDCVVADLCMDDVNGLQLLHAIRCGLAHPVRPDMCVILISGYWDTGSLLIGRQLDVNGVLAKPFTRAKLHAEILASYARWEELDGKQG